LAIDFLIVLFDFLFGFISANVVSNVLPVSKAIPLQTLHHQQLFFCCPILCKYGEIEFVNDMLVGIVLVVIKFDSIRKAVHAKVGLPPALVELHLRLLCNVLFTTIAMDLIRWILKVVVNRLLVRAFLLLIHALRLWLFLLPFRVLFVVNEFHEFRLALGFMDSDS